MTKRGDEARPILERTLSRSGEVSSSAWLLPCGQPEVARRLYLLSVGSACASRAVFSALAEHTVRSAGRRPLQPRRLRSPLARLQGWTAGEYGRRPSSRRGV